MSLFEKTLTSIKVNRKNRLEGKFNSIPFNMMGEHIAGIMKGIYYIVTANTGIGKTQLTKNLFVLNPINFIAKHPESGISLKIFYFALEESRNEFMASLISSQLKLKYNIVIPTTVLLSLGNHTLPDGIVKKILECEEYFKNFEKSVEIVDNVANPTGIYEHVRQYLRDNGTEHYATKEINGRRVRVLDWYEPNNPNEYVIVITDHLGLIQPESGQGNNTLYDSMNFFSRSYCRQKLTKLYNCAVVNVQQQMASQEGLDAVKLKKLEPSLNGLAENKTTARDAHVVLGLFAPVRYNIKDHLGYDITKLRDNYRSLQILKNRIGRPNLKTGLYFDGASMSFHQLPISKIDGKVNPALNPYYN